MSGGGRATRYALAFVLVGLALAVAQAGSSGATGSARRATGDPPYPSTGVVGWVFHHPVLTGVGLVAAWAVYYLIQCAFHPFARCLWCRGEPRRYQNAKRKAWGLCRWCEGTGQRRRIGRAVYAYFKQTRGNAK